MRIKDRRKKQEKGTNQAEDEMIEKLDEFKMFQTFLKKVPDQLRDALLSGKKATDIYKEFSHIAAVRQVLIAMTDPDSAKALQAIRDIQDRADGKPTERKEIRHRMSRLSDDELDAALMSELDEIGDSKEAH